LVKTGKKERKEIEKKNILIKKVKSDINKKADKNGK